MARIQHGLVGPQSGLSNGCSSWSNHKGRARHSHHMHFLQQLHQGFVAFHSCHQIVGVQYINWVWECLNEDDDDMHVKVSLSILNSGLYHDGDPLSIMARTVIGHAIWFPRYMVTTMLGWYV